MYLANKKTSDVIKYIYENAKKSYDIELYNRGESFKSFISIKEAIKAIECAICAENLSGIEEINVSCKNSIKSITISEKIIEEINSSSKVVLSEVKRNNDNDSLIDTSNCSKINYICKSGNENLEHFLSEMDEL